MDVVKCNLYKFVTVAGIVENKTCYKKFKTFFHKFVYVNIIKECSIDRNNDYCIPGQKTGILRIQYSHAAAAEISFGRDNLKNILVRPFKFGMWVYMGNATNAIVL